MSARRARTRPQRTGGAIGRDGRPTYAAPSQVWQSGYPTADLPRHTEILFEAVDAGLAEVLDHFGDVGTAWSPNPYPTYAVEQLWRCTCSVCAPASLPRDAAPCYASGGDDAGVCREGVAINSITYDSLQLDSSAQAELVQEQDLGSPGSRGVTPSVPPRAVPPALIQSILLYRDDAGLTFPGHAASSWLDLLDIVTCRTATGASGLIIAGSDVVGTPEEPQPSANLDPHSLFARPGSSDEVDRYDDGNPSEEPVDSAPDSDPVGVAERIATMLGVTQIDIITASGIAERTFYDWKSHNRRPRLASVARLWALDQVASDLQSILNDPAAWLRTDHARRALLLSGRFDELTAAALDTARRERTITVEQDEALTSRLQAAASGAGHEVLLDLRSTQAPRRKPTRRRRPTPRTGRSSD